MKTGFKALLSLMVAAMVFAVNAQQDMSEDAIKERIKPMAQVKVAGASAADDGAAAGPRSGADVYKASCFACHGTGALGAPKLGDAAGWGPRLDKGLDTLTTNAINGIGAMPPRGTCSNCSDEEIRAAIEHMIEGL